MPLKIDLFNDEIGRNLVSGMSSICMKDCFAKLKSVPILSSPFPLNGLKFFSQTNDLSLIYA